MVVSAQRPELPAEATTTVSVVVMYSNSSWKETDREITADLTERQAEISAEETACPAT